MAVLGDDFLARKLSEILIVSAFGEVAVSRSGVDDFKSSIDKLLTCIYADREQADFTDIIYRRPSYTRPILADRRLAEIGCTTRQIMAITGHKTMKEVERYTEEYRRLEASFEAFKMWEKAA